MAAAIAELLDGERGSLSDLAVRLRQLGLEHVMASWFGTGPHEPVTPADLRHALGPHRTAELAAIAGLTQDEFLTHLVQTLPVAVHRWANRAVPPTSGDRS